MNSTLKNALIVVLAIIVLALLARYVVFKQQFDNWGAGLERIGTWEDSYRRDHPGATDAEVDAAFKASIANLKLWQDQYKKDHPNATDAEMDAAFSAQFSQS